MVTELRQLSADELELIYKSPILVCILIAGADGDIDRNEIRKAIRFAEESRSGSNKSISAVFREIAQDFEDKLRVVMQQYPHESSQRNQLIAEELASLNPVWTKMDSKFASEYYEILLRIASEVARSSGGVLGYKSVGDEEARLLNLSMIQNPSSH